MKRIGAIILAILLSATVALAAWQDEGELTAPEGEDEVLANEVDDTLDDPAGTVKRLTLKTMMNVLMTLLDDNDVIRMEDISANKDVGDSISIQVYDVDGTSWRDCLIFTNGNTPTVTLGAYCEFSGVAIDMPTLDIAELDDGTEPYTPTNAELQGTTLTNYGETSTTTYDFSARVEGWHFIVICEQNPAQDIILNPSGTEQWWLNGTQMDAGENVVNLTCTAGESVFCFSTEQNVFCESKYTNWAQETP